jgi:VanZ family protein
MKPSCPFLHVARIADAILFWPVLALVIWGELSSSGEGLLSRYFGAINDKVLHFNGYFILGAMAGGALTTRKSAIWAVVGLICLGGVLEVIQSYVGRDMSLWDEVANSAGAISGAVIARITIEPLRRRWEYK